MTKLKAIIKLARPQQWIKNIFVFTVLIFAGLVLKPAAVFASFLTFLAFSLASSAVYFINDYKDMEEDKKHPTKCNRPLASGALPRKAGLIGFFILAAASILLPYLTINPSTAIILLVYVLLNVGYSSGLKHLVIIDVLVLSSGFVLRILAGATALSVMPSPWLVLCGVMISLFLGFTKRRAEVVLLKERAGAHRKVLKHYSPAFLDQSISIVTAATVLGYVMYTVDSRTVELVGSKVMILSVPLVLYGIFRYLYLVYHTETGGDPTKTVFTDIPILITGAAWGVFSILAIFFGKSLHGMLL
jgi:4-hydroxybenzoate polyprenyltransferase